MPIYSRSSPRASRESASISATVSSALRTRATASRPGSTTAYESWPTCWPHYFVSRGRLLNFVGWTEHDTWNREDWTDRATVARALAAFDGWHPQVRRIIAAADTCFVWALFDREPLPRWSVDRTTLLGDACHPMYPFMAQGAAQAIEDGATLAACLVAGGDDNPAEALRRYERLRRPRVTRLQDMSRANKIRFHLPDGPAQMARDAEWETAGDRSPEALRWLYGFDAGELPGL